MGDRRSKSKKSKRQQATTQTNPRSEITRSIETTQTNPRSDSTRSTETTASKNSKIQVNPHLIKDVEKKNERKKIYLSCKKKP
jgi:hypothetical protein